MSEHATTPAGETTPLRRDGNANYYNQIDPPAAHFIEQTVAVHLRLSGDGTRWIVDGPSVDGHPLDSTYRDLSLDPWIDSVEVLEG